MDPVRAAWLKTVLKDHNSQRNNIAFNEVLSVNPEYLATIKTPHDLIPFGVLKDFKKAGPVKNMYGWEHYDWAYEINEYNHRDPWRLNKKKLVGLFGSSDTFGAGCNITYGERLQEKLPPDYGVCNFATAGANMLVMFKKFLTVTNMLKFDTVILSFPEAKLISMRDQGFMALGALTQVIPHTPEWIQLMGCLGLPEYQELHDEIKQGKEGIPLTVFLMKYVDYMIDIAVKSGAKVVISGWDRALYFTIKEKYPELTAERWEWFDKAEYDKAHPGQGSHDKYAQDIYRHMKV
tara:strand:- start:3889 stop:4764 length:876 start_codon:yes stop_codon:yes gene_type:complete